MTLLAGCAESTPYGVIPVSGKIVYDDGSVIPAEEMILSFRSMEAPLDTKTHPRTGMCRVNIADGTFDSVTTYAHADGAIQGKHKVSIAVRAGGDKAVVPKSYTSELTTPLEIDTAEAPLTLKVAKPTS
ncbi:hypothetical protein [Lacipirellula sp.]|uniref:hypothetical protein n=1 Tax=Lacipirellula sp. TaxID=2691419 RepID=UPI003D0E9F44